MKTNTAERFALHVLAPDGERKREGAFPTVAAAWQRNEDMGSRWFFYPVPVVTGAARSDLARIVDTPHGMPEEWRGKTLRALSRAIAANPEAVAAYIEGKAPFDVLP